MQQLLTWVAILLASTIIGTLLYIGQGLVIPFVVAVLIWNLLNTMNLAFKRLPMIGKSMPTGVSMSLSLGVLIAFFMVIINIVSSNVHEVIAAAPRYQANLLNILKNIEQTLHFNIPMLLDGVLNQLSAQRILLNLYGVFSSVTGFAVVISLYVVFLFIEQLYFDKKLKAMFRLEDNRRLVESIIRQIARDTQLYLGIKTLVSFFTALLSWAIMRWIGLDFAEFWALLIFFLNFIPNIGSMIATIFPALLAVVQFQAWGPFLVVALGIVSIQFVIGNVIEPRFFGSSLNLSTLVILIALALWGALWGIIGMFLSIPITVMMMIVFAHFEATRPFAILLSQDGQVHLNYEPVR